MQRIMLIKTIKEAALLKLNSLFIYAFHSPLYDFAGRVNVRTRSLHWLCELGVPASSQQRVCLCDCHCQGNEIAHD